MRYVVLAIAMIALPSWTAFAADAKPFDPAGVFRAAAESGEGVWRSVNKNPLPPNQTSREIYRYALTLCQAQLHGERLKKLFEVGASMQDRDANSKGFGNFRWNAKQADVTDYNAVEFCMQTASVLYLRHRDTLPADARKVLEETIDFAIQGCLRHKVSESYTNIALMNAQNLTLLGETLNRPEVAAEGAARLDKVCAYTWQYGIHEFDSPTYYGCDLECLVLAHAFAKNPRVQQQTEALIRLFWTDIAANWFPPAQRLSGANSRSYDFVRGRGNLDDFLLYAGWLARESRPASTAFIPVLGGWNVPASFAPANQKFPRLVRSSWGPKKDESRTNYLLPDVALSTSGALYHNMDFPLTVDLADPNVRCYFIADGRNDPFGVKHIPEGATGTHNKSLHLRPFWAAAQDATDALALTIYRDKDALPKEATMLLSHVVMPIALDGVWIGEQKVQIVPGKAAQFPIADGQTLCLAKGKTAVGIKVIWSRDVDGKPAPVKLVYEPKENAEAMRLLVTHYVGEALPKTGKDAGAAFWVRVGDGLKDAAAQESWRKAFCSAGAKVQASAEKLALSAPIASGALQLEIAAPFSECTTVKPASFRGVLEVDGQDVGKKLLKDIEPMKSNPEVGKIEPAKPKKK